MTLPKRIKRAKKETRLRSPGHLKWVRGHHCCVFHRLADCPPPIEAAHVRNGTGGGVGLKPGDDWVISLCHKHHAEQHAIGEEAFERKYCIDMKKLAQEFAAASPALRRLRAKEGV